MRGKSLTCRGLHPNLHERSETASIFENTSGKAEPCRASVGIAISAADQIG